MKRKLKVEEFGTDYRKAGKASTIRLKGQWLAKLGFHPGAVVELTAISPGVLEIRLAGTAREPSPEFSIAAMRLDHAIAADKARLAAMNPKPSLEIIDRSIAEDAARRLAADKMRRERKGE